MKSMLRHVQSCQNIIMFRDVVLLCCVTSCCLLLCLFVASWESLSAVFVYLSLSLVYSSSVSFFLLLLLSQPFLLSCSSSAFFRTVQFSHLFFLLSFTMKGIFVVAVWITYCRSCGVELHIVFLFGVCGNPWFKRLEKVLFSSRGLEASDQCGLAHHQLKFCSMVGSRPGGDWEQHAYFGNGRCDFRSSWHQIAPPIVVKTESAFAKTEWCSLDTKTTRTENCENIWWSRMHNRIAMLFVEKFEAKHNELPLLSVWSPKIDRGKKLQCTVGFSKQYVGWSINEAALYKIIFSASVASHEVWLFFLGSELDEDEYRQQER